MYLWSHQIHRVISRDPIWLKCPKSWYCLLHIILIQWCTCEALWWHHLSHHRIMYGLLPASTKPLPETMLTSHWWGSVAFIWKQFFEVTKLNFCFMSLKVTLLKLLPHLPGAEELTKCGLVKPWITQQIVAQTITGSKVDTPSNIQLKLTKSQHF